MTPGGRATFSPMTTQAMAALPVRTLRDVLLAGLAGVTPPYLGALLGAALVQARSRRATVARWGSWAVLVAGIVLSAACMDPVSPRQPVLLLFIASSALGFRVGARR
jgi:hypothetical protein